VSNPFERLRSLARWSGDDDELASEAAAALTSLAGEPGLVVACRRMLAHHPAAATLWWTLAHVLASPDPADAARRCRDALDADRTADRLAAALPLQDEGDVLAVVGWPRAVGRALAERMDVAVVSVHLGDPPARARRRTAPNDRAVDVVEPWECAELAVSHLLVPAVALDDRGAVVPRGFADLRRELRTPPVVWVLGGIGRVLPRGLLAALRAAVDDAAAESGGGDPGEHVELEDLAYPEVERVVGPRGAEPPDEAVAGHPCPVPAELLRRR
jgi:hypothetical protein